MKRLTLWQQIGVGLWVAVALTAIFVRGQQLGLDHNVTNRLRYHAIPVAMSVLYHGRPHDYTAYFGLAIKFQTVGPIDDKIQWAVEDYEPSENESTYYWLADDRGMADYVIAAFALFGPHSSSLYTFYFVVLGLSALLFLLDLGRYPSLSATLIFAMGALYTCLYVIPLGNLTTVAFEAPTLFEPRLLELLALVATLHLGCASFVDEAWTRRRVAIVAAQAGVLVACYHARSSIGWEVVFVLAAGAASWILQFRRSHTRMPPVPVVCVVAGFVLLAGYHRSTFNPRYFQDAGDRTVWHNALMGLGANQNLHHTYDLGIDDRAIIYAVMGHLRDTGDSRLTSEWTGDNALDSLGGAGSFNWSAYEGAARDFYWHLWRSEAPSVLQCYLIDKPREILRVVWRALRAGPDNGGLSFQPLKLRVLIIVIPGLVLVWAAGAAFPPGIGMVLGLLACSVVPAMFFYPVVHAMMGMFATLGLALYVTLATLIAAFAPAINMPVLRRSQAGGLWFATWRRRLPSLPAIGLRRNHVELALAIGVAVATLLVAAFFAPRGFRAGFVDMAHDGYQIREVLDLDRGGTIFKDTFDQYGPLSGQLSLLSFEVLGRTLLAVKYGVCIWYAAAAFLLYRLSRALLSPRLSAFAVLVWLALAPFYQHGIMISPHAYLLVFQMLGVLAMIRFAETGRLTGVALAGVCCGLSWALKTSMGLLFAAGLIAYLLSRPLRGVSTARRAFGAASTIAGGMGLVVLITLAWLWSRGALNDWYLQTAAFPRAFYLSQQSIERQALQALPLPLVFAWEFVLANLGVKGSVGVAVYWHVIRLSAVVAAAFEWRRRGAPEALFIIAWITPALWLGAYPSANFMHQWWTASLTIPALVYAARAMVQWAIRRWPDLNVINVGWAAAAAVAVLVWPGVTDRAAATQQRVWALTDTIEEPSVLRGIRSDRQTAAAFRAMYAAMLNFKQHHPSTRIVSNDHCDGFSICVAESLLWLSFLDGNTHDHPVYWSLPALTTVLYPDYDARFWDQVARERPLIVDSWPGNYLPEKGIEGYQLLIGVASESSYWYVYAPVHPEAAMHGEMPIRLERAITRPSVMTRLFDTALDPATGAARALPLYSWPGEFPIPTEVHEPPPIDAGQAEKVAPTARAEGGRWIISGKQESPYAELLAFKETTLTGGEHFLVTGNLEQGGLIVSLELDGYPIAGVPVRPDGPFAVMLEPPAPGRYRVRILNLVETKWWQLIERFGISGLAKWRSGELMVNAFTMDRAGWVVPSVKTPVAFRYRRSPHSMQIAGDGRTPLDPPVDAGASR